MAEVNSFPPNGILGFDSASKKDENYIEPLLSFGLKTMSMEDTDNASRKDDLLPS